jgi:hypothetical protein
MSSLICAYTMQSAYNLSTRAEEERKVANMCKLKVHSIVILFRGREFHNLVLILVCHCPTCSASLEPQIQALA